MLIAGIISVPLFWFNGKAKSMYLRQVQGIEMPWYYAAWIDVNSQKINAEINLETKTKKP